MEPVSDFSIEDEAAPIIPLRRNIHQTQLSVRLNDYILQTIIHDDNVSSTTPTLSHILLIANNFLLIIVWLLVILLHMLFQNHMQKHLNMSIGELK